MGMKIIDLKKYSPIISDKAKGAEIYKIIKEILSMGENVTVDLQEIQSMATFCAKQIFGSLYVELGSKGFFKNVVLKNANNDLKAIIQIGIQDALDEQHK